MRRSFSIGPFEVDPEARRIEGLGRVARLPAKAMELLVCLVGRPGEVILRRDLIEAVWGAEAEVGDSVLSNAVWQLRRAFGEGKLHRGRVETVSRKGYSLAAPVAFEDPRADPRRSVAVLPFVERPTGASEPWLMEGFSEALCSELARLGGLRVITEDPSDGGRTRGGATAHSRPRTQGRTCRARFVSPLGGPHAARRSAARHRGRQRAGRRDFFERPAGDLLPLVPEVASIVAERGKRRPARPTRRRSGRSGRGPAPSAYELYLQGCFRIGRSTFDEVEQGVELLSDALRLAPDFAEAHASLARGLYLLASWGRAPGTELLPRVRESAARALELDSSLTRARLWSTLARAVDRSGPGARPDRARTAGRRRAAPGDRAATLSPTAWPRWDTLNERWTWSNGRWPTIRGPPTRRHSDTSTACSAETGQRHHCSRTS